MPIGNRAVLPAVLTGLALLLTCISPASAQLEVDRIEIDLTDRSDYRGDVAVTNSATDETVYVEVTVFEVIAPGTPEEQRIERKNPEEAGLLAAPRQLALAPGQTKLVRFVAVDPPTETDRVYRVQVKPVVGDLVTEGMIVKVVIGYDMLVIARPKDAEPKIVGERQGSQLRLRNVGNSTGYLLGGQNCDASGNQCAELPGRRMYPGNEFVVDLPHSGSVSYRFMVGLNMSELTF